MTPLRYACSPLDDKLCIICGIFTANDAKFLFTGPKRLQQPEFDKLSGRMNQTHSSTKITVSRLLSIIATFLLLISVSLQAMSASKDTINVMVYNLLYYGINIFSCNASNNNVDLKDGYLRTIVSHTRPDIFAVNEMGRGAHNADRILNNVMNHEGEPGLYSRALYTNTRNVSITNMLFYRNDKFGLYSEAVITNEVRDINLYTLYYKTDGLEQGDTIFLSCIVAHLKSGIENRYQSRRLTEIRDVMDYILDNELRGNIMFMGDLNMKSSFEQAYGLLTYHPVEEIRFYDPIDKPGLWERVPEMAPYHTQSTRKENVGCFASAGMDDRFDQILISGSLFHGMAGFGYLEGSYKAIGQDGNRLSMSLIDPPNYSEPDSVIMALYHMSDHLPVMLSLVTTERDSPVAAPFLGETPDIRFVNKPDGHLAIILDRNVSPLRLQLYSVTGTLLFDQELSGDVFYRAPLMFDVSHLPTGIYIARLQSQTRLLGVKKVLISP